MQQPFWRLPVCSEPPAAPNIPPRQPEKPFARAVRFSGCFILQAACTFKLKGNHDRHRPVYLSGHLDSADQIRHENRQASVPPLSTRQPPRGKMGRILGIYAGDGLGVGLLGGGSGRRPNLCSTNVQAGRDYGLCDAGAVEESHEGKCGEFKKKMRLFHLKKMFLFPLKKIVSYSMGTSFNFLILLHYQMIYMYILLFQNK